MLTTTTMATTATTIEQIAGRRHRLDDVHHRIAWHFAHSKVRARAWRYLDGLLSRAERKNGWHLAGGSWGGYAGWRPGRPRMLASLQAAVCQGRAPAGLRGSCAGGVGDWRRDVRQRRHVALEDERGPQ